MSVATCLYVYYTHTGVHKGQKGHQTPWNSYRQLEATWCWCWENKPWSSARVQVLLPLSPLSRPPIIILMYHSAQMANCPFLHVYLDLVLTVLTTSWFNRLQESLNETETMWNLPLPSFKSQCFWPEVLDPLYPRWPGTHGDPPASPSKSLD